MYSHTPVVMQLMKTSLHAAALQNLHMVVLDEADLLIGGFRTVLEEVLKALHDVAGRENVQHVFLAVSEAGVVCDCMCC